MTTGLQAYRLGRRENCDVCCHSCSSRLSHRFLATSRRFSFLNACAWCMTFGLPSFSSSSSCCKATTLPPTHAYTKDFIHTLSQAVNITIITFSCACRSGCHRCVCVYQLLLARGLLLPYSGPYASSVLRRGAVSRGGLLYITRAVHYGPCSVMHGA